MDEEYVHEGDEVTAHYSALTLHRKCGQAWYYRYGLGLRQPDDGSAKPELHFGSWWGALRAADIYERGRELGSLLDIARPFKAVDNGPRFDPTTVTKRDVLEAALYWWKSLPEEHKDVWHERLGSKDLVPHLRYTFQQWRERWADEIKYERPLGAEVFWKRELPRPEGDQRWNGDITGMPKMWLLGYIDELYEDTQRGLIVVRDHKTSKSLGVNTVIDDMMDSQLELYAWGVAPILSKAELPAVRAVAYDRAKSVAPKPPSLTTAGKLASRLGEPSIGGSDLRTYLEWAAGPDGQGVPWRGAAFPRNAAEKADPSLPTRYKEGGVYTAEDSVIEKLSTPASQSQWFQRKLTPLNANVVKSHLRAAVDTSTDIWRTEKRASVTGEASRNLSKSGCQWCDYQDLCRAQMMGGAQGVYDLVEFGLTSKRGDVLAEGQLISATGE